MKTAKIEKCRNLNDHNKHIFCCLRPPNGRISLSTRVEN